MTPSSRRAPGGDGALTKAELAAALAAAREQQAAAGEVLRVISSSPTGAQPVFDAIATAATRLCDADLAGVFRFDGQLIHFAAHHGRTPEEIDAARRAFPQPPHRRSVTARALLSARVVQIADVAEDPDVEDALRIFRTVLSVPMTREGRALGAITVARRVVRPFTAGQISLLQTFAEQAVIAIENVRLFTELAGSNRDLTVALEQQTATSEILRVISSSPTDAQPVFDTIVDSAGRLCGAESAVVYRFEGERAHFVASYNFSPETVEMYRQRFPRPVKETDHLWRVTDGSVLNLADIEADPATSPTVRDIYRSRGVRSVVWVPMVRGGHTLGAINVAHREIAAFSDARVQLLQTFADQAVIAVENVRLFTALEDKSRQLEVASQHKSEFLANMSHELRTPLNAVIGFSEVLADEMFGPVNDKQAEYLRDIVESGRHLLSLINDILDLSKIEAGRMELDAADFDLPGAVDNALTLVRERASRRGIVLERAIDAGLGTIRGDERKVKQVLLNLLSNALKFTQEGGRIDVRVVVNGAMAEVSVADTGVGIAPEDQEAVFEEFRQVGSASKKVEGTGLGLALARKFIELHGGRIWVRSAPGAGSTFTFTLPLPAGRATETPLAG